MRAPLSCSSFLSNQRHNAVTDCKFVCTHMPLHSAYTTSAVMSTALSINLRPASWALHAAQAKLPLASFMRFASDFELVPGLLSKVEATQAFKMAKFRADKAAGTITERLSFQGTIQYSKKPRRRIKPEKNGCAAYIALSCFK